jgi:hypothetical protein
MVKKAKSTTLRETGLVFTSKFWTLNYPNTLVTTLVMEPSDHASCLVSIATTIPKGNIFRFENYWMEHEHFMDVVAHGWSVPTFQINIAKKISAKIQGPKKNRQSLAGAIV